MSESGRGHVVVAGEALVDVTFGTAGERLATPGGSPLNVAVGLARLGRAVRLLTSLGADDDGDRLRRHIAAAGAELDASTVPRTSQALVRLDAEGVPTYSFELQLELPGASEAALEGAAWLHVGSLAAILEPAASAVAALVARAKGRIPVSYDPNLRAQFPVEVGRVAALVAQADVVKLSADDAQLLSPGQSPESLAGQWSRAGPRLVVLTRGADGCVAFPCDGPPVEVTSPAPHPLVDTVGAGDAFMSALIDALLSGQRLAAALAYSARAGSLTCSRPGADPPRRHELAELPASSGVRPPLPQT